MENVEARLAALELALRDVRPDRITALELEVGELRAALAAERTQIRTMRQTLRCPSCGGRRILHVRRINGASAALGFPNALSLTEAAVSWGGVVEGEPLQVFACRACGLVEWHAPKLASVEADGETIVELVGDDPAAAPPSTPYR
jgi:hypothetical protein